MFVVSKLALFPLGTYAIHKEIFTTNAVCSANHCVNPIFPGLEDLYSLKEQQFSCQTLTDVSSSLQFCAGVVNYNPSLPTPENEKTVAELVQEQEQKAMTTYFFHLSAMGMEGWDYTHPESGVDSCSESIWRLACYTYFPKTPNNCEKDTPAAYVRPCESSCRNYVHQCAVECCDESVQCTFDHDKKLSDDTVISTFGYAPHEGPSMFCTGDASRPGCIWGLLFVCVSFLISSGIDVSVPRRKSFWLLAGLGALSMFVTPAFALRPGQTHHEEVTTHSIKSNHTVGLMQMHAKATESGIMDVPSHQVGNWRAKEDYLIKFQYVPPGAAADGAILNSCSLSNLAQTLQCNGRGMCKPFDVKNIANPVMFCQCDRDYADPECRTKRKSQVVAYVLSVFFGMFGVDRFYLGFPVQGATKLVTLGGFGFWWVADIVYIGSSPVYAGRYRVAANLPHWTYVVSSVSFFIIIGFVISGFAIAAHVRSKRRSAMLYQADEDAQVQDFMAAQAKSQHSMKAPQPQVQFPATGGGGPDQF